MKVYPLTDRLPERERHNLCSQLQRFVFSIVANIAEGAGRGSDHDFARCVRWRADR